MTSQTALPLVSIVVPSFNQGRFIKETLFSCMKQDYRPIEIIVMDGGSTDSTVDVLKHLDQPELIWTSEPDGGVVDAVNKGLGRARGEILTIQSSDDLFMPGAISAAVAAFRENPGLGLIYGDVALIDQDSQVIGRDVQGAFDLDFYLGRFLYVPQPGTFFRRAAWATVGGWRRDVSYVADSDLWFRIALRFPVQKLDRMVGQYRYHDEQRDKQRSRIAADWERMMRDLIATHHFEPRRRRWARMGIHLAHHRYLNEAQWWPRTKALYAAMIANPMAVLDRRFPKRELFPAREPIWKRLSQVKRSLRLAPRGS